MKSNRLLRISSAFAAAAVLCSGPGCRHVELAGADGGDGTDTGASFSGLDFLVVIDDSISMNQEQAILATNLFAFAGALVSPLPTSEFAAVDDLRIAVVTSNMGFSSNGEENDDAWPGQVPETCAGFGDDGLFQGIEISSVALANDFIHCDEGAEQCPPGWTCQGMDADGVGVCHTGVGATIGCPSGGGQWVETSPDDPDSNLPARIACLSVQGTAGCGFEQQLASAATGLQREDQEEFVREDALLAVLLVSDEEDCSMDEGAELFATDEIQILEDNKVNLACGDHPDLLLAPEYFYEQFEDIKEPGAVFFAAIVGVPYGEQLGASACQGFGDALGDCLGQEEMQLVPEQPDGPGTLWFFRPACERYVPGDVEPVTRAYPGRRYVELASENFGGSGYVYSICNADWSPAFEQIGTAIGQLLTLGVP